MREDELSQFIYRFFILNGSVTLPGLGSLEILHLPAINDLNKQQISAPSTVTKFRNDGSLSESTDLIKYLIRHLNISEQNAFDKLSAFCADIKNEIESGEEVIWRGLGKFSKSSDGLYVFQNDYPAISFDEEVSIAASTDTTSDFHTADVDESDTVINQYDEEHSSYFVNFKTAVIFLISIILLFFIIRYSYGSFDFFGSRYEKLDFIDPPSTYRENL